MNTPNMRIIVRGISIFGLIGYAGFVMLLLHFSGMSDSSTEPTAGLKFYFCVIPFLYLLYCFFSTFDYLTGTALLVSGIIAHLAILPLVILLLGGSPVIGIGALGVIAAWFGMYFERRPKS
jgi:hypothetical protein